MHNFRYSKLKMCYCTVLLFDSCSVSHLWLAKWASCVNSWPAHTPVRSEWGTIFQTWGGNQNPDANCNTFLTFFWGGGGLRAIVSSEKRTQFPDRIHEKYTTSIQNNQYHEWMNEKICVLYTNTAQYHTVPFLSRFLDSAGCSLPCHT